jgi:hypothetical protein
VLPLALLVLVPIVLVAGLVAAVPSKGGSAPYSGGFSGTSVSISARIACLPSPGPLSVLSACLYGIAWHFSATATGGIPPYAYLWSFGDGSGPGFGQSVTHTFPTPNQLFPGGCVRYTVTVWALGVASTASNTTAIGGCVPG